MELDGHPTQDIINELQRRGCTLYPGTDLGPDQNEVDKIGRSTSSRKIYWMLIPSEAFETGLDEDPAAG